MSRRRPSFTSAHAISLLALFVALGGTSYAVTQLPKNSVGSAQVKDRSLTAKDLAADALRGGPAGAPGARGPRGEQGPAGPQGAAAPGLGASVKAAAIDSVVITRNAWDYTTVLRIKNLAAGRYRLDAAGHIDLTNTPDPAAVWCQITSEPAGRNGTVDVVSMTGTSVGEGGGANAATGGSMQAFADFGFLQATEAVDLSLRCNHWGVLSPSATLTATHAKLAATPIADLTRVPQ